MQFHVYENPDAMSEGAAEWIASYITEKLRHKSTFSLLLSGGNTPKKLYSNLASAKFKNNLAWEKINVFFGDERYVPFSDKHNNGGIAYDLLLKSSGIPASQIHFIDTRAGWEESASQYENKVRGYFKDDSHTFDLALLGIGNDGHTLSLFPGKDQVHEQDKWVVTSEAPDEPVKRI